MKSAKLITVRETEPDYGRNDGTTLFWNIFNSNEIPVAISSGDGTIYLSNHLFNKQILQRTSRINLQFIIKDFQTDKRHNIVYLDEGDAQFKLTIMNFPSGTGDPRYLLLGGNKMEADIHHKMSVLRNLYRSFVDTSFEMIFRTSPDGQIIFANRVFLKGFGVEHQRKIKGHNITDFLDTPEQYLALQNQLIEHKSFHHQRILFRRSDHQHLIGLVNCHAHQDEYGALVYNWTVLDITHQVGTENSLTERNNQLSKVNHQMERFLYSTSHDLRAPITTILGLVNLVKIESQDSNVIDFINKIEQSTNKLDKIIRDIMSFSRTTYKGVASERVNFDTTLWKVINNFHQEPAFKKIQFEINQKDNTAFFTDVERLEIIAENIIRNAINFFDVNKSRSFISINVILEKNKALLEFIDNGIGIGQQHLTSIFNMFYKASHLSKGAGLGLYIAKEAVEKLKGTITVESEIGFGTLFRVVIPNDHKGKLISRKLDLSKQTEA